MGGEGTAALTKSLRDGGTLLMWGFMAGFTTTMTSQGFVFRDIQARTEAVPQFHMPASRFPWHCKRSVHTTVAQGCDEVGALLDYT